MFETETSAILAAALVAALASLATLFFQVRANRTAELRKAHRTVLIETLPELSEAIHQIIATSSILLKCSSPEAIVSWKKRGQTAKSKISLIRPRLRYPLWGISDHIHLLSRFPDWIAHSQKCPNHAKIIAQRGQSLGKAVDWTIMRCFRYGRPPTLMERWIVNNLARRFRRSFDDFKESRHDPSQLKTNSSGRRVI